MKAQQDSLITSNGGLSSSRMVVEVILGLQKLLCFRSAEIELDPLLVDGLRDSFCLDSSLCQPRLDSIDAFLGRCEHAMYAFRREELSVQLGVWVGTVGFWVSSFDPTLDV
jgi:hypothetical protein